MVGGAKSLIGLAFFSFVAATPSSTNYTLKTYDFGNGGGRSASSAYDLNSIINGQSGTSSSSTTYRVSSGLMPNIDANVPGTPTFINPSNEYNRLHLTIDDGDNPSSTGFAIAISDDNFATTFYVQPDNTIGSSYSLSNYQSYTAWGGSSGFWIIGLAPNTTYKVKVRALNGDFSGSAFSPVTSAVTVLPSLTFSVETSLSSTPPLAIAFTNLTPGLVYSANADAKISLTTNALFGGQVYINDQNAGLTSPSSSYTINTITGDLSIATRGYGAQVAAVSQDNGGPLVAMSPFDSAGDTVGILSLAKQILLTTSQPIENGQATVVFKAKTNVTVPSSGDYQDVLTFTAAMSF